MILVIIQAHVFRRQSPQKPNHNSLQSNPTQSQAEAKPKPKPNTEPKHKASPKSRYLETVVEVFYNQTMVGCVVEACTGYYELDLDVSTCNPEKNVIKKPQNRNQAKQTNQIKPKNPAKPKPSDLSSAGPTTRSPRSVRSRRRRACSPLPAGLQLY